MGRQWGAKEETHYKTWTACPSQVERKRKKRKKKEEDRIEKRTIKETRERRHEKFVEGVERAAHQACTNWTTLWAPSSFLTTASKSAKVVSDGSIDAASCQTGANVAERNTKTLMPSC